MVQYMNIRNVFYTLYLNDAFTLLYECNLDIALNKLLNRRTPSWV